MTRAKGNSPRQDLSSSIFCNAEVLDKSQEEKFDELEGK
jgi:hypothetical protein